MSRKSSLPVLLLTASVVGCQGQVNVPNGTDADGPGRPGFPDPDGDPGSSPDPGGGPGPSVLSGLAHWQSGCASCHGAFDTGAFISRGNDNGDFRLNVVTTIESHGDGLAAYIEATMPLGDAAACQGDCAAETAAYLASLAPNQVPVDCASVPMAVGTRQLKLLTSSEYQRSLERLLGVRDAYGTLVANNDSERGHFPSMLGQRVDGTLLEQYLRNASAIAEQAVSESRPFSCQGQDCAQRFVDEFLPQVFRGPPTAEERAGFEGLFAAEPEQGLRLALEAALSAPRFLYRVEAGIELSEALSQGFLEPGGLPPDDGTLFALSPHELASALSFMLTGTTPDADLLQAASGGRLQTRAQIREQASRLLESPEGRRHMGDFIVEWFDLDRVLSAQRDNAPDLTDEVRAAMVEEVKQHFLHVFYRDEVPFSELFGSTYTFLNQTLAQYYGVEGSFGSEFVQAEVEGRGGPIASGAFMAGNAHVERSAPILRAVRAREQALCHFIDPPNAPIAGDNIDAQRMAAQDRVTETEAREGALSSRDFYYLYTDGIDACASCHERVINPMFGMEDFDHAGRLRPRAGPDRVIETIQGIEQEVSLQGTLYGIDSTGDQDSLDFVGAKDLSNQIADTQTVKNCLIRRSFRYLTGLPLTDDDADTGARESLGPEERNSRLCLQESLRGVMERAGDSPRAVFVELATERLVQLRR